MKNILRNLSVLALDNSQIDFTFELRPMSSINILQQLPPFQTGSRPVLQRYNSKSSRLRRRKHCCTPHLITILIYVIYISQIYLYIAIFVDISQPMVCKDPVIPRSIISPANQKSEIFINS